MKALLTGAQGLLGSTFQQHCPPQWNLIACGHSDLDILDPSAIQSALQHHQPELLINCAAYTAVDQAETEVDLAMQLNATGPSLLAKHTAEAGIPIVHISTDFVFNGEKRDAYCETDPLAPLSVYGHTKAIGERFIRQNNPEHLIVRTAWLYGDRAPGFPHLLLRLAERGTLRVVTDQRGSPTYAPHLVSGLVQAVEQQCRGTLHLAGSGSATRYEWAQFLMQQFDTNVRVDPAVAADFPTPARRPENSVLESDHPSSIQLPHWHQGVQHFAERSRPQT